MDESRCDLLPLGIAHTGNTLLTFGFKQAGAMKKEAAETHIQNPYSSGIENPRDRINERVYPLGRVEPVNSPTNTNFANFA